MGGEDGLDFGKGVEPIDKGFAFFTVVEAGVELLHGGMRETSDFSGAGHGIRGIEVGRGSRVARPRNGAGRRTALSAYKCSYRARIRPK